MPKAAVNGLQLEYETFGEPGQPPLVLIMGLGAQMLQWHERLCAQFVERGHYVVRFDNRDVGLSTKLHHLGASDMMQAFAAWQADEPITPPYTLGDMADDVAGLLEALDFDRAHICGASMGGMIAQTFAIRHPDRLLSLTSMESTTGAPGLPQPEPEALQALLAPVPEGREGAIAHTMRGHIAMNGTLPMDEEWSRELATRSYDRDSDPDGWARQTLAVLAQEDRTAALGAVDVPALVLHGTADPLVPPAHGKATAAAIPGAELVMIEGWGHGLIPAAWPEIVDAIATHTHRARAAA